MSTQTTGTVATDSFVGTELEEFHDFVTRKLMSGQRTASPEDCVAEFREFFAQKVRFLRELEESREEARRGEARPLDVDEIMGRVRQRAAAKGITD